MVWLRGSLLGLVLLLLAACGRAETASSPATTTDAREDFLPQRERMLVEDIERRGVTDPGVLAAMRAVPRHLFVPQKYRSRAYADHPLPIGQGQTISQPFIVALMSQLLEVAPGERVLEVGTGSGYQAAILAQMGAEVYSVEIIPVLADESRQRLDRLGYSKVLSQTADGYFGWAEHGPFDGIMVTAAPDHIPALLLDQLKPTGKMVIPVGPPGDVQTLWLAEQQEGKWVFLNQGQVRFVPLVGGPAPGS